MYLIFCRATTHEAQWLAQNKTEMGQWNDAVMNKELRY